MSAMSPFTGSHRQHGRWPANDHTGEHTRCAALRCSRCPVFRTGWIVARVVDQMLRRASSLGFDAWWRRAANAGFCAAPIQLAGTDRFGRERSVWVRCNNRRASVCASCSDLYARDTWQLVHAGLHGGHHRMPASIAEHPQVFVTLTAPGFGPVHTTGNDRNGQHGRPLSRSPAAAGTAGVGMGNRCGAAPSTAMMMRGWVNHYAMTATTTPGTSCSPGTLPSCGGASPSRCADFWTAICGPSVRSPAVFGINYVKVAEMQRRAIPHFHAVIRLDGPPAPGEPPRAPVCSITATDLAVLVRGPRAPSRSPSTTLTAPAAAMTRVMRFGSQTDTQPLQPTKDTGPGEPPRSSGRSVATYLAKYVTKSVAEFGVGIRRMSPLAVTELDVTAHVRAILTTITAIAAHRAYHGMDRWLHTLGYRGHISTKSRLFSTTMGALRALPSRLDPPTTRRARRDTHRRDNIVGRQRTSDAIAWEFDRAGLCNLGERALILSAAQRMIEHRHTARDHLRAHDPPAHRDQTT